MRGMTGERTDPVLAEVLWSLRPYLPELVLIGGWVPRLYRDHGGFAEWRSGLSGTMEVDLLVSPPIEAIEGRGMSEVLREAGFSPSKSAAIWSRDVEAGERIEFLQSHRGTAKTVGRPVPVEGQQGLEAISLEGLDLLRQFSTALTVPVIAPEGETRELEVNVPTLGAYLVNKALTAPRRPAREIPGSIPKRAKDVVYIRDIMAAGEEVLAQAEEDVKDIVKAGRALFVERARGSLISLRNSEELLCMAVEELAARDRIDRGRARSEIEGSLVDLAEILEENV